MLLILWVIYVFWVLTLYQIYDLQILCPIQWAAFSYCWWFPLPGRIVLVGCNLTCSFYLSLPLLLWSNPKNYCQDWCKGAYPLLYSRISSLLDLLRPILCPMGHIRRTFSVYLNRMHNLLRWVKCSSVRSNWFICGSHLLFLFWPSD